MGEIVYGNASAVSRIVLWICWQPMAFSQKASGHVFQHSAAARTANDFSEAYYDCKAMSPHSAYRSAVVLAACIQKGS